MKTFSLFLGSVRNILYVKNNPQCKNKLQFCGVEAKTPKES